jgi:hypothetical protein
VSLSLTDRVINRLARMEVREQDAHLRDDYRQSRLTMAYAHNGSPIPFVEASYEMFGAHPERVWERIGAMRKFILGPEYGLCFDESGNLRPQFFDVPDYDASLGLPPQSRRPEIAKKRWTPKAPLRRVLKVNEIRHGDLTYHLEELECGHSHTEFLDANLGNKRRRCHGCATQTRNQREEKTKCKEPQSLRPFTASAMDAAKAA